MSSALDCPARVAWLAPLAALVLAACGGAEPSGENAETPAAGASGAGGSEVTGGSGGTGGATGGSSTAGTGPGGAPPAEVCPTLEVPRTPLRRLTRFEYKNSVRDLLGVEPAPADELPADEVTNGFDNNASVLTVSALHAEKYVLVSEALARTAVQNLAQLTTCDAAAQGDEACAREFAQRFGRRAFRRPITAEDEQAFMAAYAAGRTGGTHAEGIEVMIRAALQSPDFLYRLETTTPVAASALVPLSAYERATRLAFLAWASGPDDALLDAAGRGELDTPEGVAQKAREMLSDPRARRAVTNFFNQWAGLTRLPITNKDTQVFPTYTADMKDAMARELPAFVEHVIWNANRTLSELFTSPVAFVSGPLGSLYGVAAQPGSETTPALVALPETQGRAGLLTQAGFLAVQAHPDQTSPVLRGKFVRTMLLCDPPEPPPPDVDVSLPDIDQGATARERFGAHLTAGNTCSGCHTLMDPIGLTFEHFDAMGQFRQTDGGQAIDVSGQVFESLDPVFAEPFNGVHELAERLAASSQVKDCVATQWFRFAAGRLDGDPDACSLSRLRQAFGASGGDLVELVVAMTQTDAFWFRSP